MKNYFAAALFMAASIAAAPAVPVYIAGRGGPAAAVSQEGAAATEKASASKAASEHTAEAAAVPSEFADEPYKVLDAATGEVLSVPVRDYVIGAVCAEMPAAFPEEALRAQAVAAHTYAERQRKRERSSPTEELKGADFSNDTSKYQGYFTREQIQKFYGDKFDENYAKVTAAVDEVLPYILTYKDEPAIAAFHSMSSGKTESAENAWGTAVDYLVPVDSSADVSAPKYLDQKHFSRESLKYALETAFPGIILGEDMAEWVKVLGTSDSGTVLKAQAGDKKVTGSELRSALALRSACFEVSYPEGEAVFTTRGYGHGVGMSQYGAESMANDGSSWQDILKHYYPGCEIGVQKKSP